MRHGRGVLVVLLSLFAATLTACSPESKPAPEIRQSVPSVPISPAGYLGQFGLSSPSYEIANRFVVSNDVAIDRWYYAMNGEGADCVDGRDGYGAGDGGIDYGRIVDVDQATGLPTNNVLGAEKVNSCAAHVRAEKEFGLDPTHQVHFVQMPPVSLKADRMYAFVLSNVDPNPGNGGSSDDGNYMSPNLNFADLKDMGSNGRNTLDPSAGGAAYGLDPRETTMWSDDAGSTWKFGDQVGWYDTGNGMGRMWPGGYRVAGGPNVPHGWSYMNWPREGKASITYTAEADEVLTNAGGASRKGDVGVIKVENLDNGASASTEHLGTGLVSGRLSSALPVTTGQRYVVSTDGQVGTGSAEFWDRIFDFQVTGLNEYESSCPACDSPLDHPMLYASS